MLHALSAWEPTHVVETLKQDVWHKAMEAELNFIEWNWTWELVPHPASCKVIGVRWVFKTKYHNDGLLDKHKAQLVAKGYA